MTLNRTELNVSSNADLVVLAELDEDDEKLNAKKAHDKQLDAVGGRIASLLQVSGKPHEVEPDAHGVLGSLSTSLELLNAQQNATEVALRQWFDNEFAKGMVQQQHLL